MPLSSDHGWRAFTDAGAAEDGDGRSGGFGYLFPDAVDATETGVTVDQLDAVADAMREESDAPELRNSTIPPILAFLAQLVGHDVAVGAGPEAARAAVAGPDLAPRSRAGVLADLANQRRGTLGLDCVYGDPRAASLSRLLRCPRDPARLRVAPLTPAEGGPARRVPLPADEAGDLPRLGRLLEEPEATATLAALRALPEPQRRAFLEADGMPLPHRAVIGDPRNDDSPMLAQLHLAFLRFHNSLADACDDDAAVAGGRSAVFAWARDQVRLFYQWLLLNRVLPDLCDPETVRVTIAEGAPLYARLVARSDRPVIPLEFWGAAWRFGHSMMREAYDYNRFVGRPADGSAGPRRAPLLRLLDYTGGAPAPMPRPGGGAYPGLPADWAIEWERFALAPTLHAPDRSTRRIDTRLAPFRPQGGSDPAEAAFRRIARLDLRRGYRLNLPSGQDCVRAVNSITGARIAPLGVDELRSGPTGPAMTAALTEHTPLWLYILKEAEMRADGEHLGPLGSRLVTETVAGLVINDPASHWSRPGSDGGRWHPADGPRPVGEIVDSLQAFLRAGRLL